MGEANVLDSRADEVPQELTLREDLRRLVQRRVSAPPLCPPLLLEDLRILADQICEQDAVESRYQNFLMVLINNEVWRTSLARIPFHRRILLLPQCLRTRSECPAEMDEIGVVCELCGRCPIGELITEAQGLGYAVLVSEGTGVVTRLLEQGQADAVVGASCLSVLERSFPFMAQDALPGAAIPLVRDGCNSTLMDREWLREFMHLRSDDPWVGQEDLDRLRQEARSWFEPSWVSSLFSPNAEPIAVSWVIAGGKRWRPILCASVFAILQGEARIPDPVKRVAVALECFHKASLIHDDIEDDEVSRYNRAALHREHGIPIALNVGDYLLGQGYRLMAESKIPSGQTARLLVAASEGHCRMCLGQGEELAHASHPWLLSADQVLSIFRRKTGTAFEVSLIAGALCANADEQVLSVLGPFSEALGIAYQIRDDLEDLWGSGPGSSSDLQTRRPSLILTLAVEEAQGQARKDLIEALQSPRLSGARLEKLRTVLDDLGAAEKAKELLEHHRKQALSALTPLLHPDLKVFLHRILRRILKSEDDPSLQKSTSP